MQDANPPVVLDTSRVVELEERSDFDPHQSVKSQEAVLGEHLGDGFFLQMEPVLVQRDRAGNIIRTVPMHEAMLMAERAQEAAAKAPPLIGREKPILHPLPTSEREKLAGILANRLFAWYDEQPPSPTMYNPIYDGIPEIPPSADKALAKPLPGTRLYSASKFEVYEWLCRVVASRITLTNRKKGIKGHQPDLSDYKLSIQVHAAKE